MSNIISAELFKLKKNMSFWLIAVVMAVATAAMAIYMPDGDNLTAAMADFSNFLPLFSIIVVVSLAQNDDNAGTMKNVVSSGVGRFQIYFGKLIVAFIAVVILFIIDGIATAIAASSVDGFSIQALPLIESIIMQLIIALTYTAVFYFIGTVITKGSFAIIVSYLIFIGDGLIFGVLGSLIHLNGLSDYTMNAVANTIESGHATAATYGHFGVLIVAFIVCLIIGAFAFSKKDIK